MKRIMRCLALVALAVFTSASFAQQPTPAQSLTSAQQPTLTSVEVKFHTTTDSKHQQTKLDVYVETSDGQEVAKSQGNGGRWNNHSTHTVKLRAEGSPTKGEVANGRILLTIHPQRWNKWSLNYKVTLKFSNGTFLTREFHGCVLSNHDPARADSLKG
jgi:hypothetical protein